MTIRQVLWYEGEWDESSSLPLSSLSGYSNIKQYPWGPFKSLLTYGWILAHFLGWANNSALSNPCFVSNIFPLITHSFAHSVKINPYPLWGTGTAKDPSMMEAVNSASFWEASLHQEAAEGEMDHI